MFTFAPSFHENIKELMAAKKEKRAISTVAVTQETNEKLDAFCTKYDINKKQFIELALDYFQRTGVDIFSDDKGMEQTLQAIKDAVTEQTTKQADTLNKLVSAITQVRENTERLLPPIEQEPEPEQAQAVDAVEVEQEQDTPSYWQRNKVWLSIVITILVIAGIMALTYFLYLKDYIII